MLPYSRGLILDNTRNYGIMKTETVFGFGPPQQSSFGNTNTTEPIEWVFTNESIQKRSIKDDQTPQSLPNTNKKKTKPKQKSTTKDKQNINAKKNKKRKSKKINKCIIKFMKGQGGGQESQEYKGKKRRRRRGSGGKFQKMQKKYMMPVILGLLAAKSILIPIALKALAFMSAKGLMMGFFSTVLASVISLKGMFHYPHESSKRNDDSKTQVEIIQVPTKSEDHVYYDEHYRRGDFIPVYPANDVLIYDNNNIMKKKSSKIFNNDVYRHDKNDMKKNSKT